MIVGTGRSLKYLGLGLLIFLNLVDVGSCLGTPDDYLALGDEALGADQHEKAIEFYNKGLSSLTEDESLLTVLSLHTNLGSALSTMGENDDAAENYQRAISVYLSDLEKIADKETKQFATDITSQASFFLGMVYQDLKDPQKATDAYGYAVVLDPNHWGALANLGSVLHDDLRLHDDALQAYNKAYSILTEPNIDPTDPPAEPRFILSQLQYRIGLCLAHDPNRKCALEDNPDTPVSCKEMAAHAFSLAVQYDPDNESAKHMLATTTADATMTRASNTYIRDLFQDYAKNFEHSLVQELGYTGYERLRRGFDRAFGGQEKVPKFPLVIDAGCGTGLAGEQFRNVSEHLIGVDLSEAILDEAEKARPGLYDERIVGDLIEVFEAKEPSLIIAADSYIYFGDLVPLFEAMQGSLPAGAYAAFTLENVSNDDEATLKESKPDWRWQLTASGRFAHRKEYVAELSEELGLKVIHYEELDGFRFEHGVEVRGHMFVLQKKSQEANSEL